MSGGFFETPASEAPYLWPPWIPVLSIHLTPDPSCILNKTKQSSLLYIGFPLQTSQIYLLIFDSFEIKARDIVHARQAPYH